MKIRVLDTFPVEGDPEPEEIALRGGIFETTDYLTRIEMVFGAIFPKGTITINGPTESHILYVEEYEIVEW